MKTKKAEATRNAILEAAEKLFMEKSVSKVTISDIVTEAAIAKGTFYLYFESKDDLVWTFVEKRFEGASVWIDQMTLHGHDEASIRHLIDYIIDFVQEHAQVLKMMHDARFYGFLGLKRMKERYFNSWIKPVQAWLEEGQSKGVISIDNPSFLAHYLVITTHEMMDYLILDEAPFDHDEMKRELGLLLIRMLGPVDKNE